MTTKIINLIAILTYSIIVSQAIMYILSLRTMQMNLQANSYTEVRQLIDASMRYGFKYAIYAALLANVVLAIINIKTPTSLAFITAAIALMALVIDIILTLKGNLPINDIINGWSIDHVPSNWAEVRSKWFCIFQYRQLATTIGFVSLVIGALFGSK
jgi:hypothetical protein